MDEYQTETSPSKLTPTNFTASTPVTQTESDCTLFSSNSQEQLNPESYNSSSTHLASRVLISYFGKELAKSYSSDSETDSQLEYEYQKLVQNKDVGGGWEMSDSDSCTSASENICLDDDRELPNEGNTDILYLRSRDDGWKMSDSNSYSAASENICLDDDKELPKEENTGILNLRSRRHPSEFEDNDDELISEWENHSDNSIESTGNWRYLSPTFERSRSPIDFPESFIISKSKNEANDPDEIYSNQTSLGQLEEYQSTASSFSEIVPKSLNDASSDKNVCLLPELVSLTTIGSGTSNERSGNDYWNEDMNDVREFSDARNREDISNCCKIQEANLMELAAEEQIAENNIVQQLENYNCNNIVSSEVCSDISKLHDGVGKTSFILENNDQNLSENPLSCFRKESNEVFGGMKETRSISEGLNVLEANSTGNSHVVYCTQCKYSIEERNKRNLSERKSEPKEPTKDERVNVVKSTSDTSALLELFKVDNTVSRKILLLLSDSDFRNGATVTSMLKHVRNDVPGTIFKLKNDIKTFFRAAINAEIIQKRRRRYFLKTAKETESETVIRTGKMQLRKRRKINYYPKY